MQTSEISATQPIGMSCSVRGSSAPPLARAFEAASAERRPATLGPLLSKANASDETRLRQKIKEGSRLMPGYKLTLTDDQIAQVPVGRRNDAQIDFRMDPIGADLLQLAGLEESQQQTLHAQGHVADFVEEQRAAVGGFEQAGLVIGRAGERAANVAEELRLEKRLGNGAAVERDEPLHAPRTVVVDGACDNFFAGAGLSGHENRAVGGRDGLEQLEQLCHRPTLADDAGEAITLFELRAKIGVFRFQPPLLERGVECMQQLVDLKRLADEIARPALEGLDRVLHGPVPGHDDGDDFGVAPDRGFDDRRAGNARQAKISNDDVERKVREPGDRLLARVGLDDLISAVRQLLGYGLAQRAFVFDQQDMFR